ncbi:MAG TPA: hypothetical protein VM513_07725 [Kofleriaceae bacterium]|nr:hypothetical protein [Kofleriaceae bacterium]
MTLRLVAALTLFIGCTQSDAPPRAARGTERGDCRPAAEKGAVGTCDPGLLCLSNLCVRPPPADCSAVGERLASFDLGNYAEPDARVPVVAKYKAACEKAFVSKEQGDCIAKADSNWAAKDCAPAMFPELKSTDTSLCGQVMVKIKALIDKQMGTTSADPSTAKLIAAMTDVMRQSCEQDGWPDALKQCLASANDDDAMTACNSQMPPSVQQKISERMQKAMSENMQTMPPPPPPPPPSATAPSSSP